MDCFNNELLRYWGGGRGWGRAHYPRWKRRKNRRRRGEREGGKCSPGGAYYDTSSLMHASCHPLSRTSSSSYPRRLNGCRPVSALVRPRRPLSPSQVKHPLQSPHEGDTAPTCLPTNAALIPTSVNVNLPVWRSVNLPVTLVGSP